MTSRRGSRSTSRWPPPAYSARPAPSKATAPSPWSVVTRAVLSEYYSHPWAWNEIGFGGPAYPRGYMRLSDREPFEAREAFDRDPVG